MASMFHSSLTTLPGRSRAGLVTARSRHQVWRAACAKRMAKVDGGRPTSMGQLIDPNGGSTVPYVGNLLPARSEQNVAVEAQDPLGRHGLEQDHGWPVWGAAIRGGLERRGLTIDSAGGQLGVRHMSLQTR